MAHRILVADDEEVSRTGLAALLRSWGHDVVGAATGDEALTQARAILPAVVIADVVMPGLDGIALLAALRAELPFAAVVLLTGHGTVEAAVAAMKQGAHDYLTKPVDTARLRVVVQQALEKSDALREVALLRRRLKERWGVGKLVGTSPPMQEIYRLIELAAPTPAPVLLLGESGTGKELVAQTLHELSPRRGEPFVAVNCSAIPETLLESEIFGHEKGAFTGALERRAGCFELAHGGTLFLDEVAEMATGTQAKFLRILQDGMVRRLGGKNEFRVDVRVVAATNKDPTKALQDGQLREDLYYRLNVFSIRLPPLREHLEDVPLLAHAFVEEFGAKYDRRVRTLDDAALRLLSQQRWPGNVRELRNTIERAVINCDVDVLGSRHLPDGAGEATQALAAGAKAAVHGEELTIPLGTTVDDAEKALILATLGAAGNNKTKAAEVLKISLKTLHNKLRRYGL